MSWWLAMTVAIIYGMVAVGEYRVGNWPMVITFGAYAVSNIGLMGVLKG